MNALFNTLKAERKQAAKFGGMVRKLIEAGTDEGKAEVIGCAEAIEAAYPVSKVDGKDENKDERNDYLRALRMALMRAGRGLKEPRKLTIKKIEGAYRIVSEEVKASEPASVEGEAGEGADDAPESIGLTGEDEQAALWAAVELVSKHLSNKAIRLAIADALKTELAKAAHV